MILQTELQKLKKYSGTNKFNKQLDLLKKNFNRPADKKKIAVYMKNFYKEDLIKTDNLINEKNIKLQLAEISDVISLSYIAEKYFSKTRQWLYARINNNIVNGKPASFTQDEIKTFNSALKDIGKKIGSTSISLQYSV